MGGRCKRSKFPPHSSKIPDWNDIFSHDDVCICICIGGFYEEIYIEVSRFNRYFSFKDW